MQQVSLKAKSREKITKGTNRQLRMAGEIPAVIYGGEAQPVSVSVNDRELHRILSSSAGFNVLITMEIEGGKAPRTENVIVKDIQRDPVKANFIHLDFYRISMDKELTTYVPVEIKGSSIGVKAGGILEFNMREIEVECLPTLIPERFVIDVTALEIHDSVHVKDLQVPEGVKILEDAGSVVVGVVPPTKEEVVAPVAEATAAEPEVIEKGKKEEPAEEGKES
jgi:large subunit ribosomal protein L25